MSGRDGAIVAATGVAVVVVAHPPQPYPYVFESVSMGIFLPLVATTLTVAGGIVVALDGTAATAGRWRSVGVSFTPLWSVSLVAAYLSGIAGFGPASPLVLFSLALGFVAGLVVAATGRLDR